MENIIAIIPALTIRKHFGFSFKTYTLVVFEEETVFARLTSKLLKKIIADARAQAESEGKGFFGKWGAQLLSSFNYSERYKNMSIDEVKNETPGNFSVANNSISKITIRYVPMSHNNLSDGACNSGKDDYYVKIYTSGEKYKFRTDQDPAAKFKTAFGPKVK